MKIQKVMVTAIMLGAVLAGISACGDKSKSSNQNNEVVHQNVLEVDSLLANAANLVNQEVMVQAICTHTCKHGATKLFLMGSDDTKTIRVEACALGSFDTKCVNSIVLVKGILKEDRIDEAYLQTWESTLNEQGKQHGEGEAGCDSEKKARGESGNSPQARIADFRAKIAAQKALNGKEYLSFYHIDALSYEIQ